MTTLEQEDGARLCSGCVGEGFLKAAMDSQGVVAECSFCAQVGKTYSLEEMADHIETALNQHYRQTPPDASPDKYAAIKEGIHDWRRKGEPVLGVIQSMAGIAEEPARKILSLLHAREPDTEDVEGKFDDEAHYEEAEANDWEIHSGWLEFEKAIKTEARFFSPLAEEILARVFENLDTQKTVDGTAVLTEAGPGKTISVLFRARTFQSDDKLERALCRPDLEIGLPPPRLATAGRMNAHGISVFYGATDPEVAVAEVRPPVGSRVIVGQFQVIRPVHLLDVEALRSVGVQGSIFDPLFIRGLERAKFLERLSHRISMPVVPDDEPLEHLVTQVVADYLSGRGVDGILFPSVQVDGGKNVVLFHKAARVEELAIPEGAEVDASLLLMTLDGLEPDYRVAEKLPHPSPAAQEPDRKPDDNLVLRAWPFEERDPRDTTLRLDVDGLEVRHIKTVSFKTVSYRVNRQRYTKGDGVLLPQEPASLD